MKNYKIVDMQNNVIIREYDSWRLALADFKSLKRDVGLGLYSALAGGIWWAGRPTQAQLNNAVKAKLQND